MSAQQQPDSSAAAPAPAPTAAPETKRKITLKSADGELFSVDEDVAMEFATVKRFFEDNTALTDTEERVVPLPNAHSKQLSMAITFCSTVVELKGNEAARKIFEESFVREKSNSELKGLIWVGNYLEVKHMLDVLSQGAADRIKDKSVEYARKFFGIENDFTPEEEARVRAENEWAFLNVDEAEYVD
ncbi:hypothetical protein Tsubulata_013121 [Turnera subulata]|uniref:SKP1-like protein n=1 Tax=Turnera subulata TaxID=218843 RepID=A0A9Q0FE52_9ROSI|nr:hypothetical protein Tsubulata_013121 [Turnera subulata]